MIPKTVHRVWLGGEEPAWTKPFAETWNKPGWVVHTWTDDDVEELFPLYNQEIFDSAEKIAPDNVGQLRGDVLRYEILYRQGGVYVDTDFECLRSIDELVGTGVECFAAWEETDKWINNAILGSEAGYPLLSSLVENLAKNVRRYAGFKPNKLTGPQYLTKVARGQPLTVYPKKFFYPYLYTQLNHSRKEFPDAFAVHHWANRRRERGVPLHS